MHKLITYLHAAIMGGEKAVVRSLSVFDKVVHGLQVAVEKLEAEEKASLARHQKAWDTYLVVEAKEARTQANIDTARTQATTVIDKVTALTQG